MCQSDAVAARSRQQRSWASSAAIGAATLRKALPSTWTAGNLLIFIRLSKTSSVCRNANKAQKDIAHRTILRLGDP